MLEMCRIHLAPLLWTCWCGNSTPALQSLVQNMMLSVRLGRGQRTDEESESSGCPPGLIWVTIHPVGNLVCKLGGSSVLWKGWRLQGHTDLGSNPSSAIFLLAMRIWASYLTFMWFSCHICKMILLIPCRMAIRSLKITCIKAPGNWKIVTPLGIPIK